MEVRKLPVDMVHVEQLQLKKVVAIVLLPMSTIRDELARLGLGCVRDLRRAASFPRFGRPTRAVVPLATLGTSIGLASADRGMSLCVHVCSTL